MSSCSGVHATGWSPTPPCGTVPSGAFPDYPESSTTMATAEQCRTALETFAAQLASNNEQVKSKLTFERTLACDITDLGISFHGKFSQGALGAIADGDDPSAEIRMTVGSDDLVALVNNELEFGKAFASGRVKLKASIMDLLKLKAIL